MSSSAPRFLTAYPDSARNRLASELVVVGELGLLSGIGPVDLANDRTPLPEMVEAQTERIFANLDALLKSNGITTHQILAVRVHLVDFDRLYERMNLAYQRCVGTAPHPVRTCLGVSRLTRGALIEMDFTLRLPG